MNKLKIIASLISFLLIMPSLMAQDEESEEPEGYIFTRDIDLPVTPVKNQYRSGTCWSFSSISFLESELLRTGKGEYDLSEMFIVKHAYSDKARKYVRMNGHLNMAGGGAFHDVTDMIIKYGIVPEDVFNGKVIGEEGHIHGEMDNVLKAYTDAVIKNKNKKLTPVWHDGFDALLDVYLGPEPESFTYEGKDYTPAEFASSLGLNMDDYIEISSFTHHPFYSQFILEVPDNWAWGQVYNVPLDEMMQVIDYALENGYTIAWGSDVSEKGFSYKNGVAVVPEKDLSDMSDSEISKWDKLTKKEQSEKLYSFDKPGKEKEITQELRQESFDSYTTTDDHGMHIVGTATDQDGTKYYTIKNSWADNSNKFDGYFYASVPFVAYKTLDIMVHRDGIPKSIRKKLGLK